MIFNNFMNYVFGIFVDYFLFFFFSFLFAYMTRWYITLSVSGFLAIASRINFVFITIIFSFMFIKFNSASGFFLSNLVL